jgi:hypothetical protein
MIVARAEAAVSPSEHYRDEKKNEYKKEQHYKDEKKVDHQKEQHYKDEKKDQYKKEQHYKDEKKVDHQKEQHYKDEKKDQYKKEQHYKDEKKVRRTVVVLQTYKLITRFRNTRDGSVLKLLHQASMPRKRRGSASTTTT